MFVQPIVQDLDVFQGDTFEFFFRLREKVWNPVTSAWEAGPYIDLENYTGKAQIRENEDAPAVLAEMSVIIADQAVVRGGVLLTLTPVQTAALPVAGGRWDVQLTSPTAEIHTYIRGAVKITKEVTRA